MASWPFQCYDNEIKISWIFFWGGELDQTFWCLQAPFTGLFSTLLFFFLWRCKRTEVHNCSVCWNPGNPSCKKRQPLITIFFFSGYWQSIQTRKGQPDDSGSTSPRKDSNGPSCWPCINDPSVSAPLRSLNRHSVDVGAGSNRISHPESVVSL